MPGRSTFAALAAAFSLAACSSFPQRLTYDRIDSAALGTQMDYAVYTPPGWTPRERLPLVLFLHGGGDDEDCFDRWGIGQRLDVALAAGDMPRAVICVPNGELGFWENWHDGSHRYRDWVLQDLLPHVREQFHTLQGREHTHVMGISMGGHGTLRLALLAPEQFASAAAISAPVMDAEHLVEFTQQFWVRLFIPVERIWGPTDDVERVRRDDLFARWQTQADLRGLRFLLVHGTDDRGGIVTGTQKFHQHLDARGIEHAYFVYDGRHKWVDWRPILPAVLRFLLQDPEQTPDAAPQPE